MATKILHGSRVKVLVQNTPVGVFNQINYGVNLVARDIDILGAFATQEIVITGYSPIEISLSGYSEITKGPFSDQIRMGKLQDLLDIEDIVLAVYDRETEQNVAVIVGVKVVSFSHGTQSKDLMGLNVTMRGTVLSDEEGTQGEPTSGPRGAAQLP